MVTVTLSQGQVGVDGERGRPGAPGQPVGDDADLLFPCVALSLDLQHEQPAGALAHVLFTRVH